MVGPYFRGNDKGHGYIFPLVRTDSSDVLSVDVFSIILRFSNLHFILLYTLLIAIRLS